MAEQEGAEDDGHPDVEVNAAEALIVEGACVAPDEGEADGEGQQQGYGDGAEWVGGGGGLIFAEAFDSGKGTEDVASFPEEDGED